MEHLGKFIDQLLEKNMEHLVKYMDQYIRKEHAWNTYVNKWINISERNMENLCK